MKITVYDEVNGSRSLTPEELTELAPVHLELEERVPGVEGRAFDVTAWYEAWHKLHRGETDRRPVYMTVEAVDEFQATIPWEELGQAVFLYEQGGKPLKKGYPIRLYVPDGSSECLNVKSVITIHFGYQGEAKEASYGFKNRISPDELKLKK